MSDRTYRDGFSFTPDYDADIATEAPSARGTRPAKSSAARADPRAGRQAAQAANLAAARSVADELPRSNDVRWVRRRKAQVVAAVRGGILTLSDALARYSLSLEEFIEWEREVASELQERRRTGRLRELTKSRHGANRRAN